MQPWAQKPTELFKEYATSKKGLSNVEAQKKLKQYNLNEIARKDKKSGLSILIEQFTDPLVIVLLMAAIIAIFLNEKTDAAIIITIVLINAILGFIQEFKAEKTVRALRKLISHKSKVLRDNKKIQIDAQLLVPGDLVFLNIGDIVPADIRLINVDELTIDESSLTGESIPVIKTTTPIAATKNLPQDLTNMAFMGTHVVSGNGQGIVIATGKNTSLGRTAAYLKEPEGISDFERSMSHFSRFLLKVIMLMTFFIFIVNAILQHGLLESFLFALALAVGITPEALPIIITISLSKGAQKLAKSKVIVKKLTSIEDLGNMDILCTDKTGTLTEGKLSLENFIDTDGQINNDLLVYSMLCNDAVVTAKTIEGNSIDQAIWNSKQTKMVMEQYKKYKLLDHNEFDFNRRRMSVIVKKPDGQRLMIVKGALESLASVCDKIRIKNVDLPLNQPRLDIFLEQINAYRKKGYSTICIALKKWHHDNSTRADEKDLTLIGFLTFIDPPRASAHLSIKTLQQLCVSIKVLSGDDPLVTKTVCDQVGLKIDGDKIYTGDELEKLSPHEFLKVIEKHNVFSRITPDQKYQIVKNLNTGENRTIAFMGDGINDAPAIKIADVGISVDNATDIAKEAADIILLQKNLKVITDGITEGRKIFTNITKYILNTVSANYGNMFTVAISSLFLNFIPLLPSQILLNNLITDTPMIAIATDKIDHEQLKKPKKLDLRMISRFMTFFGLLSTIFDLTLILALLLIFNTTQAEFRTAWFLESALSEIIVVFALRTTKTFYKSTPGKMLTILSISVIPSLLIIIYSPLGTLFEFTKLPATILLFIIGVIATYFFAAEISKRYFFSRLNYKI